jgi:hypothetical protein
VWLNLTDGDVTPQYRIEQKTLHVYTLRDGLIAQMDIREGAKADPESA